MATQQSNWLSAFHAARDKAMSDVKDIRSLSQAFMRTGNANVASDLLDIARTLEISIAEMDTAVAQNITESYDDSMRNTWGTLAEIARIASEQNPT